MKNLLNTEMRPGTLIKEIEEIIENPKEDTENPQSESDENFPYTMGFTDANVANAGITSKLFGGINLLSRNIIFTFVLEFGSRFGR